MKEKRYEWTADDDYEYIDVSIEKLKLIQEKAGIKWIGDFGEKN